MNSELITLFNEKKYDKIIEILENDNEKKINVNVQDENNNYLITYAVLLNDKKLFQKLIEHDARLDILDNDNRSLLFIGIKFGYYDIIEVLLNNTNNIGVDVSDVKDIQGYVALHYAIIQKNIKIIEILLKHGSKINTQNNNGYGALHLAVITRNYDICKLILSSEYTKNKINMNIKCNTGETALHIAVNLGLSNIVKLLLDYNIDPNIQENDNEYTALHYSIFIDNINIIKNIIENEANVNIQDIYGNTPLHYSIIENNYKSFLLLISDKKINVNLVNLSGKTALHVALYNENIEYVEHLLHYTNLNMQDNMGNTVLHLIIKLNLWKNYLNILSKKKLNNNLKNNDDYLPIDYINNEKDKNIYIDTLVDSYLHTLQTLTYKTWSNELENMCKNKENEKECKEKIRKTILTCSYPQKNPKCFKIEMYSTIDFCTFTGNILDVYVGMIFLLKKHENSTTIYVIKELIWMDNNIVSPNSFSELFEDCLKNSKRFIIIPLGIVLEFGSHANYIIFDKKDMTFERFEPHGSSHPFGFDYNSNLLDSVLSEMFKKFKYFSPKDFLPRIGLQILDVIEEKRKHIGDPSGFCAIWSIWYTDMRLTYYDMTRSKLINMIIKTMRREHISFKKMIRNYSQNITKIRDEILIQNNLTINDWLNEYYTTKQINDIFNDLRNKLYNLIKN